MKGNHKMNKERILEEFAKQLDYWVEESVKATTDATANLEWSENEDEFRKIQKLTQSGQLDKITLRKIIEEILRGYTVSLFTVFDGGTSLAEEIDLSLVTGKGEQVGELHDEFVMHLVNSGRLTIRVNLAS